MDSAENAYRGCVLVVLLLSGVTALYHRVRAARSGERLARHEEGWGLMMAIRLSGLLLLAATLHYLIAPGSSGWTRLPLPAAVRWSGAVLGALALILLAWTLHSLGTNLTDTVVTRRQHTLVTSGPYRWVRHPYYVVLLLLVVATSALAARWTIAAAGLLAFILLAVRTPLEEQRLVQRFGNDYRRYMDTTPRYVPRLFPSRSGRPT